MTSGLACRLKKARGASPKEIKLKNELVFIKQENLYKQ